MHGFPEILQKVRIPVIRFYTLSSDDNQSGSLSWAVPRNFRRIQLPTHSRAAQIEMEKPAECEPT